MHSPSSKKEYPWHLPSASAKHQQWFRHIIDFHGLTSSWASEVKSKSELQLVSRGRLNEGLSSETRFLDSLSDRTLESFLDDSTPEQVLRKLDQMVWAVQAITLSQLLDSSDREALLPVLNQSSWKYGRMLAERQWACLPAEDRLAMRNLLSALHEMPFMPADVLLRRSTESELQIELNTCPHHVPYVEVRAVSDLLCGLHAEVVRGFVYALNERVTIRSEIRSPRCLQVWSRSPIDGS